MGLEYRSAGIDELSFLVRMRVGGSRMFSECVARTELEDAIRKFHEVKMKGNAYRTLLTYTGRELAATVTLYFHDILSSNESPSGRAGQVTSVWVDEAFRRQGIAAHMVERLMGEARRETKMVRLSPSERAFGIYEGTGFFPKKGYLVYYLG